MTHAFDHIPTLNASLHFCEDFDASGPVDAAAPVQNGPLTGRIIGVKANMQVAGQAWTAGIGARAGNRATADAPVVAQLRAAGGRILSRMIMDEGALGAATDNPHFGRCENPAWPGHSVGGSSGGSAAAASAGAVDAALGSDTMGSVRIPAAYCGVYGLKLGNGAVPMDGVFPLAPSLDALGILSARLVCLSDVLNVIMPENASSNAPAIGLRGWLDVDQAALAGCAPEVQAFYTTCHAALAGLMGPAQTRPLPDLAALRADAFLLTEVEAVASLGREAGLSAGLVRLIDYGRSIDAQRQQAVRARMQSVADAVQALLGTDHVMLLPTVAAPAFEHGARAPANQADFTALANVAGCPALSIPQPGAVPPVAVQIMGPKGSERALVALAEKIASRI